MEQEAAPSRVVCPECGRSKGLGYCGDCLVVLQDGCPSLPPLPVKVDIVLHGETSTRSTALHAALLAPAQVRVFRHDAGSSRRRCDPLDLQLPDWDAATTAVLFPEGPNTPAVGSSSCPPFQTLVVLESSWRKAKGLLAHPQLARLPRVQLPPEACGGSEFTWRRGDGSFRGSVEGGMSSIEAIQRCCRLLDPSHDFDALLHWFRRTKRLVDARGPLPTSRQEARARQRQKREHQPMLEEREQSAQGQQEQQQQPAQEQQWQPAQQ
ncbi:DTW domain-containing 1 [Chlorella sorokiniana]|uniref:tRNA-uridine aminocarboxypropyltransferase 1 n=1 Tax=Chlorella sorokiniana TaxID=3076 RepID=A0A2P6TLQ3_CHLSO|nr:DTW domain-containing 1 [Chlorella sorokiniana]|eukprot:PRW45219.1 DTW domain-containing 1 [Chlorella sorokiniana]